MEIGPTSPVDPLHRYHNEHRQRAASSAGEPQSETSAAAGGPTPHRIVPNGVEKKARRVAELIRERRDNGFYHRMDVLREVVSRLMESQDLDRAGAMLN